MAACLDFGVSCPAPGAAYFVPLPTAAATCLIKPKTFPSLGECEMFQPTRPLGLVVGSGPQYYCVRSKRGNIRSPSILL